MSIFDTFFRYFPTPKYMAMPHVGVDVSGNSIKYMELVKGTNGLKLGRFGTQVLPNPINTNEPLSSNSDLVDALRKIQRTNKFNFVEISIPEERAYLFTMEVPDGNQDAIRSNIEFHLEENVPVALSEAVFDYHIIRRDNKKGSNFISVSVVPRNVLEEYIDLFEQSGMTPISFLIENQAVSKALISEEDMSTYIVVNIGQRKTVLSVVSDQTVQFTSTVNIGGDDFVNAIAKEYSVVKEEAEVMKQQKGFVRNNENTNFFMSLVNVVSALRDEIQRVSLYWLSHADKVGKDTASPIRILLAGQDSSIIGLREYLALSMKLPVELANVWKNVLSFENEIPPIEYLESLNYATVVGLALPKSSSAAFAREQEAERRASLKAVSNISVDSYIHK